MNHQRASFPLGCFFLLLLFPLLASAAPRDPCKVMQHDLDQQIDDLKAWQKLDLQECYKVSGSNSDECRRLKDRHAQDLQGYRDERAYQMANCRGYGARGVAAVPSLQNSNNDSYNNYCINHGKCVQYPYADCSQYDRYIHDKLHHYPHHDYSDPTYSGAKTAYAGKPSKPSKNEAQEYADKGAKGGKRDAGGTHNSAPGSSTQSALRSSDRDTSSNHGSGRDDSPPKTASSHNHDNGGTSNSSSSHASSGASHTSGGSSSSAGSSSGGHPSGGGGSAPSSGSSSSGAGHSSSASSGNSAASTASSTASPASSASHDSGGSHPH